MSLAIKNKPFSFAFVAFIGIFSIDMWSFRGIDVFVYNAIEAAVLLFLFLIILTKSGVFFRNGLYFKTYAILFLLIPLPSIFGAALYHNQTISQSLYINRFSVYWLFYFVLHIFDLNKEKIIKLMLFIGAVWASITIIQQFTYPTYYFYSRDDDKKSIYRAGVYRYMLGGNKYGLFLLLHYFYKYLNSEKLKYLALTALGLAGFYYYGTRQTALAAAVCMCASVLLLKGLAKWKNIILIAGLGLLAMGVREILFAEYIEMTSSQLDNEDDIRILAGRFFLFDYWPSSAWGKILGNGRQHPDSAYGNEIEMLKSGLHFFRSDVGIIGSFNTFGILYVFLVFAFVLKGISFQFKETGSKYLRLFFFNAGILLIINEGFSSSGTIPFFCFLMYVMDKIKAEENAAMMEQAPAAKVKGTRITLQPA